MSNTSPALFSSWSPRVALFAAALAGVAILLHRLLGMPTPLALNLIAVAFGLATLAILMGVVALGDVWRRGVDGGAWAVIGIFVAGALFAWPLTYVPTYYSLPKINDASTDIVSPPPFLELAKERERSGVTSPAAYPAARFAELQKAAYPDLRPLYINRSPDEVYELALDTAKRLRFQIVSDTAPRAGQAGEIEAIDRTMVVGFYDDVAIRVTSDGPGARVDVRSASRFGQHDLGRNASRVRRVLSELQSRVDASVATPSQRFARIKSRLDKTKVKRGKGGNQKLSDRRRGQDSSRSGAQRAPVQKATPPSRASAQ